MKTIFWDVDTQNDFMHKAGSLYVPDAEMIMPNLAALTQMAVKKGVPVFGSVDKHFGTEEYKAREGELVKNCGPFPDHCMNNSRGQKKIEETVYSFDGSFGWFAFDRCPIMEPIRYVQHMSEIMDVSSQLNWANSLNEVCSLLDKSLHKKYFFQAYFEKQSYDVFSNPAADYIIRQAKERYGYLQAVVYGVATDYCVKAAVLGLQKRGLQCYVVEDAIKGVAEETTKKALEDMVNAGAKFIKTKEVKQLLR